MLTTTDAIITESGAVVVDENGVIVEERIDENPLRFWADSYDQVQRTRLAIENRFRAALQERDGTIPPAALDILDNLTATEKLLKKSQWLRKFSLNV